MDDKFFFVMRANVYDPEPWRERPGIMFQGGPLFFATEHEAVMWAKSIFLGGGYDVVIMYRGDWGGSVWQLYRADRYSSGELPMPAGYAAAVARSAGDAADVLRHLLDSEFSIRR